MRQAFQGTTLWDQIYATEDENGKKYDPSEMEVYTKAFEKGVVAFRRVGDIGSSGEITFSTHENATAAIMAFKEMKNDFLSRQPAPALNDGRLGL